MHNNREVRTKTVGNAGVPEMGCFACGEKVKCRWKGVGKSGYVNSKGGRKCAKPERRKGKKVKERSSLWVPVKGVLHREASCVPRVCSITSEMTVNHFKLVPLIYINLKM
jgi:hypothetical protein